MSKVLVIKANPKLDEDSNTFKLLGIFLKEYEKNNPNDTIETLDLYKENVRPLDANMLYAMFNNQDNEMIKYAKHFASFDKYIFAAPMWNLSIPSILKAYFDYICYVGITFKYTETGAVGLLTGKKVLHIVSRGGAYGEGMAKDFELGDRYIRVISHFLGIEHVKTLTIELTNVLSHEELEKVRLIANEQAIQLAKEF